MPGGVSLNHLLCWWCSKKLMAQKKLYQVIQCELFKFTEHSGGKAKMASQSNSLSHTRWLCKYQTVFTPKYRRKAIYGQYKESMGQILRQLCNYKGMEIIEEHLMMIMSTYWLVFRQDAACRNPWDI